jgi:hypothetical protein
MNFIKRKDLPAPQAIKVVCSVLKLINLSEKTKPEIIELTQYFIDNFYNKGAFGKPLFFENLEYKPTFEDIVSTPEGKKIIDEIEAKYLD